MDNRCQQGFSLIEMMVAMVIGIIIIIGAGSIFLNIRQTQTAIQDLGDQLSSVTFVTDALVSDIRRATSITTQDNEYILTFPDGLQHRYRITPDGELQQNRSEDDAGYQTLLDNVSTETSGTPLMTQRREYEDLGRWDLHLEINSQTTTRTYELIAVQRQTALQRNAQDG